MEKVIFHDNDYYYDIVRKNVKRYRKFLNITQQDLADRTGYTLPFIGSIESEKLKSNFSLATVGRFADALLIDIRLLFNLNNSLENLPFVSKQDEYKIHNDDYYYDLVRYNLKRYRKFYGVTQKELANKIGVKTSHIGQIESDKVRKHFSISLIGNIVDALNIDIKILFTPID